MYGIKVSHKRPKEDPKYQGVYTDYDNETEFETKEVYVHPQFKEYYSVINEAGYNAEDNYPLTVSIMSKEYVPENSRFIIDRLGDNGETYNQEWKVLSTEVKQIDGTYSRIASCVPARTNKTRTSRLGLVVARFDISSVEMHSSKNASTDNVQLAPIEERFIFNLETGVQRTDHRLRPLMVRFSARIRQPSILA